jgi:YD repeat-containing protein
MGGVKVQRLPAQSTWPPAEMIPNDRTERLVDLANTKGAHYGFAYNRSVTVTTPLGDHTLFAYDAHGRLLAITAADGRQTQYLYGAFELPAQVIDALGRHTALAYDIEGNLTARTDRVARWSVRWDNSGGSAS